MQKKPKTSLAKAATYTMLTIGIALTVASAFYASSFLAILGVAIIFWGVILLYITPAKHVPLALLNAAMISATENIERSLSEANLSEKGRYLPPSLIRDFESSMVFIPETPEQPLPTPEEVAVEKQFQSSRKLMFITPPGQSLCQLFEKELGVSFTKTNLDFVQQKLPKLLVEDMELAETADLQIRNDTVTLELTGNVLKEICQETRNLPRTHSQLGCLLSSAVACVLAKASGKVVIIQEDKLSDDGETTRIECRIEEAEAPLWLTTPEGLTQEQPVASLSPTPEMTPEIIVDKPVETIVTAQAAPDKAAPTLADPVAALDTVEELNSEPATPAVAQRQEYQEISSSRSILHALKRIQSRKTPPKSQEKQALLDLQNLNKTIDEQEKKLYTELAAVRQQIEKLRQLTQEEKTSNQE